MPFFTQPLVALNGVEDVKICRFRDDKFSELIREGRGEAHDAKCRRRDFDQGIEPECEHEEHDHGICLYCGADITDRLVDAAEYAKDQMEKR